LRIKLLRRPRRRKPRRPDQNAPRKRERNLRLTTLQPTKGLWVLGFANEKPEPPIIRRPRGVPKENKLRNHLRGSEKTAPSLYKGKIARQPKTTNLSVPDVLERKLNKEGAEQANWDAHPAGQTLCRVSRPRDRVKASQ
jgi:hypothetical protein